MYRRLACIGGNNEKERQEKAKVADQVKDKMLNDMVKMAGDGAAAVGNGDGASAVAGADGAAAVAEGGGPAQDVQRGAQEEVPGLPQRWSE